MKWRIEISEKILGRYWREKKEGKEKRGEKEMMGKKKKMEKMQWGNLDNVKEVINLHAKPYPYPTN